MKLKWIKTDIKSARGKGISKQAYLQVCACLGGVCAMQIELDMKEVNKTQQELYLKNLSQRQVMQPSLSS